MRRTSRRRRTTRNGQKRGKRGKTAGRRTSRNKEMQKLIAAAQKAGWTVDIMKGGHIRFLPKDKSKPMVVASATPSDPRSVKNLRSQLRRSGLKVNRKGAKKKQSAGLTIVARPTGRVLLLRRSQAVSEPGLWSIPAGRVEKGEDALQGALRELKEEAGYDGPLEIVDHIEQGGFHNFVAVAPEEFKPTMNWENDMCGWFAKGYHPQPLHPGTRGVLLDL